LKDLKTRVLWVSNKYSSFWTGAEISQISIGIWIRLYFGEKMNSVMYFLLLKGGAIQYCKVPGLNIKPM
jgi:hypothetical protein